MSLHKRDIIIQGEYIYTRDMPEWLRQLIEDRQELAEECKSLGADPAKVIPGYTEFEDPFNLLEHLGAWIERNTFEGGGPGGGGRWRTAYMGKRAIKAAVRKANDAITKARRELRIKHLVDCGIETFDLDDLLDAAERLQSPAPYELPKPTPVDEPPPDRLAELEDTIEQLRSELDAERRKAVETHSDLDKRLLHAVSDHHARNIDAWSTLGIWPIGPFAWLNDGSVAYLRQFLNQRIDQHAASAQALAKLREAGVRLHAVDCWIDSGVRAQGSGCGFRRSITGTVPGVICHDRWERAWDIILSNKDRSHLKLPPELADLASRLKERLGTRVD